MSLDTRGRYIFDGHPSRESEAHRLRQISLMYEQRTAALICSIKPAPDSRILDAGCGPGGALCQFARSTKDLAYGLDLSIELLEQARAEANQQGLNNIRLVHGDMHNMPFDDEYFDIVFSRFAVKHAFEPVRCVTELSRVLKVGGRLCVIEKDTQAGLAMWFPAFPFAQIGLFQAINRLNASPERGGNSNIGRQLKHLFVRNGIDVTSVSVECCPLTKGDAPDADQHRDMFLNVYRNNVPVLVEKGLITPESAYRDIATLESYLTGEGNFAVSVNFTVVGTKRGCLPLEGDVSPLTVCLSQAPSATSALLGDQTDQTIKTGVN
jgi:SAM-dependent methyltransferase